MSPLAYPNSLGIHLHTGIFLSSTITEKRHVQDYIEVIENMINVMMTTYDIYFNLETENEQLDPVVLVFFFERPF